MELMRLNAQNAETNKSSNMEKINFLVRLPQYRQSYKDLYLAL
jgi:hypothetical protein